MNWRLQMGASALLFLALSLPLAAQSVEFRLGTVETYPAASVALPFLISSDVEGTGWQISVEYDSFKALAVDLNLAGVLAGAEPEFLGVDIEPNAGEVMGVLLLDTAAPFDLVTPVGSDVLVAELLFEIEPGLTPGTAIFVDFAAGGGGPALQNMIMSTVGTLVPTTVNGGIAITDENHLLVENTTAAPGDLGHVVPLVGMNTDNLQGFSIVGTFDPAHVHAHDISVVDTITEVVGAEFVEPNIDNAAGFFVVGVLLDLVPPFDGQTIPATGLGLAIANLIVDVLPEAANVSETPIGLQDGLGTPPVDNVFVIGLGSVSPQTVDGVIEIVDPTPFVRGDANGDDIIDIADPVVLSAFVSGVWPGEVCLAALDVDDNSQVQLTDAVVLAMYLFSAGPPPPPPFPDPGVDPTPPFLPCELP